MGTRHPWWRLAAVLASWFTALQVVFHTSATLAFGARLAVWLGVPFASALVAWPNLFRQVTLGAALMVAPFWLSIDPWSATPDTPAGFHEGSMRFAGAIIDLGAQWLAFALGFAVVALCAELRPTRLHDA